MRIAVFGTGYVGLVSGVCFAEMGIEVACVDIDQEKVLRLRRGEVPIYEPGLEDMLAENLHDQRLHFTTDAAEAVRDAEACFICVGTPMAADGSADLRYIESVARDIGSHIQDFTVIVVKSTVPVGTCERVHGWVQDALDERGATLPFAVASNPEFLKEGAAVEDFMRPDRVVIGIDDRRAELVLRDIYEPFIRNGLRIYAMDIRSSEMTKYASNCMLATKISFINEVSNICEAVGADVRKVRMGVGADRRIGYQFLHPGVGYGGSCFPKDVSALIHTAEQNAYEPELLRAVDNVNRRQKTLLWRKLQAWCELTGCRPADLVVAVWGLAFKPNTDDVRDAPSIELIRVLLEAGMQVRAHDPKASEQALRALGQHPRFLICEQSYEATEGADVLCVLTEWRPYRRPDFRRLAQQLRGKTIFDGRNLYDSERLAEIGLQLYPMGYRAPAVLNARPVSAD
ncbi:MAG: UDP-glucose dehydrogenase family protein [Planctomycetota bacterium]